MYEDRTYEVILEGALARARGITPGLDTRAGSLAYTALGPAAAELAQMYIELDNTLNEMFADTQTRPYLIRRAAERGVFVREGETTEQLRARYIASLNGLAFGGNIEDYRQKAGSLPGVGGVRVAPAWDGPGTVLVTVTGADNNPPPQALADAVQEALDPPPGGAGTGLAPIGHTVTVRGAEGFPVAVAAQFVFRPGYDFALLRVELEEAAARYFALLREEWGRGEPAVVRVSALEQRFLAVPGVTDVIGTSLSGAAGNLTLPPGAVPVPGGVTDVV
jgi:uncharacterized phage protein gp47/JayE